MVFTLARRRLTGIGKDVLLHGFLELFAIAEGDLDTTGIFDGACDGFIPVVSHLMVEEVAEILLVFVPQAFSSVRENHFRVCRAGT
jgi:hypothetical protein